MNRIFLSKMMECQREYFDFAKIPKQVIESLYKLRTQQLEEFQAIIWDIYRKTVKKDVSSDLIFEKLRHTFMVTQVQEEGNEENDMELLKNKAYEVFEVFTNEKLLTHYSYYTQKTIKIIIVFEDNLAKLLCEYGKDTEDAERIQNLTNIYRDKLNAVICSCHPVYDKKKVVDVKYCSDEIDKCMFCIRYSLAPELHFDQPEQQVKNVLNELNVSGLVPLKNGNFFLTKHSNVANVNAIFHVVVEKDLISSEKAKCGEGLSQVFNFSCFSFSNLFVSIPLFTTEKSEKSYYEEFKVVVDCLKNGLKKYDRCESVENVSLNTLFVIVPNSDELNSDEFKEHCAQVVHRQFKVKKMRKQKIVISKYFSQ